MSNMKVRNRMSKLFFPLKSQDLLSYYHKQAVERLECRMPNKRTSQHTDFKSYQLSTDARVRRNLPLTFSQPYHDPGVRHMNSSGVFVQCVVHKAMIWKESLHAAGRDTLQADGGKQWFSLHVQLSKGIISPRSWTPMLSPVQSWLLPAISTVKK